MEVVTEATEVNYPIEKKWIVKQMVSAPSFISMGMLVGYAYMAGTSKTFLSLPRLILVMFAIVVVQVIIVWIINSLRIKFYRYCFGEKEINLKQGILSRQERHLQYGTIQNVLVKQDLLDRFFGLATLTVQNAAEAGGANIGKATYGVYGTTETREGYEPIGFAGNSIVVPGLDKENAEILKSFILGKILANPIDDSNSGL